MQLICAVAAFILFAAQHGAAQPAPDAMQDFARRVNAYAELRASLEKGAAEQDETRKPDELVAAELALAARIRAARPAAARGDIFSKGAEAEFRRVLKPEWRGISGQNTRGAIYDEGPGPGAFKPQVNAEYPSKLPLGTVPPNVLQALPKLPENLEYRFVGKHLILRDARANLIVDYILNVLP